MAATPPKQFVQFLDIETEGAVDFVMDPQWPAIEAALRLLNGTTKSLVVLEGPPPMHMNIGGGNANRYVVSLTYDTDKYYVLQNPEATTEIVELTVGGGTSQYPVAMLVPLELTLVAAKTFAATGEADPTLPWLGADEIAQPNAESVPTDM
jgi:hypothetical protein